MLTTRSGFIKHIKWGTIQCVLLILTFGCNSPKSSNDSPTLPVDSFVTAVIPAVDKMPYLEYLGLIKNIQPMISKSNNEVLYIKDSLLSIYLEDHVNRLNYYEGIFRFSLQLAIDDKGLIRNVTFLDETNIPEVYREPIIKSLYDLHLNPAILNNKQVSVTVKVLVQVDLYSIESKIRKSLFKTVKVNSTIKDFYDYESETNIYNKETVR